mmetsp:Transcript_9675/g.17410  ORF Transcript_9675/g.17410 Transcript_9675/m.17410 type:complete len:395 (+) Transcript_9675:83-1267(+)
MLSSGGYSALDPAACFCGRQIIRGYDACCRACKESSGERHGLRCDASHAMNANSSAAESKSTGYDACCRACSETDGHRHGSQCEAAHGSSIGPSCKVENHEGATMGCTAKVSWDRMPPELLLTLPDFLGHPRDVCFSEAVCHEWRTLGSDACIWQRLCNEWYPAMVAKVTGALDEPACIVGCGRSAGLGYSTCCRKCKDTQGEEHGSKCESAQACVGSEADWRDLFQARYERQQAWDARKHGKEALKKERAERERQQSMMQDKQRGQNFRGQEIGLRSVRTKTCKRCGLIYLPKDNDAACSWHPGRCQQTRQTSNNQENLQQLSGSQVQQALWALRRKGKKLELGSRSANLTLLVECGIHPLDCYRHDCDGYEWRWTCCSATISTIGCVSGVHS